MNLTKLQRDVLLEHIDQPNGVPYRSVGVRSRIVRFLIDKRLLYGDRQHWPRRTFTSEAGRWEIGRALGALADGIAARIGPPGTRKLTESDVTSMRRRAAAGEPAAALAAAFEISPAHVYNVIGGTSWPKRPKRARDRNAYMRAYKRKRREEAHADG